MTLQTHYLDPTSPQAQLATFARMHAHMLPVPRPGTILAAYDRDFQELGMVAAYSKAVTALSIYPEGISYPSFKLVGEILGELLPAMATQNTTNISKELGDSFWYIMANCHQWELDYTKVFTGQPNNTYNIQAILTALGTICEHAGKCLRDDKGQVSDLRRVAVQAALTAIYANLLRYIQQFSDVPVHNIFFLNIAKLSDRFVRDKIHGDGNDR